MGKYLNGYEPDLRAALRAPYVPPGWNEWDVAGNGYGEYNYLLNENHRVVRYGGRPRRYLTDVLSRLASSFVRHSTRHGRGARAAVRARGRDVRAARALRVRAARRAPVPPPAARRARRRSTPRPRRQPALARRSRRSPPAEIDTIDRDFRRRVAPCRRSTAWSARSSSSVARAGLANNTYFVFSSDNGYHMGEHRLRPGKMTAFDTDIRVPLDRRGPGDPARHADRRAGREHRPRADLRGAGRAHAPPSVDGRSLVPLLEGQHPRRLAARGARRAPRSRHRRRRPRLSRAGERQPAVVRGDAARARALRRVRRRRARVLRHRLDPYELRNAYRDSGRCCARSCTASSRARRTVTARGECHLADQLLPYASSTVRKTATTLRPIRPRP